MHREGVPLMRRMLPAGAPMAFWDHYPTDDVVCPRSGARYFYHAHPPGERLIAEHGHFHLFLGRGQIARNVQPLITPPEGSGAHGAAHIAALSVDDRGVPIGWFTVNRWVTDEWLFPAAALSRALHRFDLRHAPGDQLVNQWLTAAVALSAPIIGALLAERDAALAARDPSGEDRAVELIGWRPLDLQALLDEAQK